MSLRPIYARVVIEPDPPISQTASGLFLVTGSMPETKFPEKGTVVAVGPGRIIEKGPLSGQRAPMNVKAGDKVQFSKYGVNRTTVDGTVYVICEEDQIYTVIEA